MSEIESVPQAADDASGLSGGSVVDAYAKNHSEIQRRHQLATDTEKQNPRTFERAPDAPEIPFKLDAQTHFVWSASHESMAPKARDARHPALRIYGLFPSHSEAVEHAQVVASLDPTCSLMVSPTHEWTVLPRAPERLADAETHVAAVLAAYDERREESKRTFEENVAKHRGGKGKKRADDRGDDVPTQEGEAPAPRRLGRDAEVRDQSLVAVSFVEDTTQPVGEPVFQVYAAFANTIDADAWARAAGDTVVAYDIDVVSTCVWLFPNDVAPEKIGKEVYRSKELESIISNHRKQPQMCENFERWRQESESEA